MTRTNMLLNTHDVQVERLHCRANSSDTYRFVRVKLMGWTSLKISAHFLRSQNQIGHSRVSLPLHRQVCTHNKSKMAIESAVTFRSELIWTIAARSLNTIVFFCRRIFRWRWTDLSIGRCFYFAVMSVFQKWIS